MVDPKSTGGRSMVSAEQMIVNNDALQKQKKGGKRNDVGSLEQNSQNLRSKSKNCGRLVGNHFWNRLNKKPTSRLAGVRTFWDLLLFVNLQVAGTLLKGY